ncbi:MAG: TlpA family protein disulfide reductase [Acidimicrobiaceae bacterium]|nr:TlpA family protein disulfide reductase [Acidimicrobiaceae bacterium]MBT5207333.1 TlpA family protein disulfide reductase [Acidimicrobiaceae bacterium]MBT6091775.1 TlpA family protein disulfide reductase [Acidimicrobiaceae bacterium]
MTRRAAGAILAASLVLLGGCTSSGDNAGAPHSDPVTTMAFELWDGSTTSLADLVAEDGRPVVVNMWATWCAPCLEEMPDIQEAHESLGADVRFLGINVSDSPTLSARRVTELGITYLQGRDPEGLFTVALEAVGLPVTAFIGSGGDLEHVHHGRLDTADLEAAIMEYLS